MTHQTQAVTVYSKPDCSGCFATKRRLDKNRTTYTLVDMAEDDAARNYVRELGHTSAPVVVLEDGTSWAGYNPARLDAIGGRA